MKNVIIIFGLLLTTVFISCNNSSQTTTKSADSTQMGYSDLDTGKARQELNAIADDIHSYFKKKDIGFIDKYLTKDGIYVGSDPGEFFTFDEFKTSAVSQFKDTAFKISDYPVSRREIRIYGPSAVIIDQFTIPEMFNKLMARSVSHARYENGKWMLDLYTWNFILKNEDVPRIGKAL